MISKNYKKHYNKKITFTTFLLFGLTTAMFSQEVNIESLAKKDTAELTQALKLNDELSAKVYDVFLHKHKSLTLLNLSNEEKKDLYKRTKKNIKEMLGKPELILLEKNSALFNKLTSE